MVSAPITSESENLRQRLLELFNDQRYSDVNDICAAISGVTISDPLAAQIYGASLFKVGQFTQAYDILNDLTASLAQSSDFWSLYGAVCRRLGRLSSAKNCFQAALSLDPESLTVQNNYANLLVDLKEYHEAITIFKKILSLNPNYPDAAENLNRAMYQSKSNSTLANSSHQSNFDSQPIDSSDNLFDPLMQAFSIEESLRTMRLKSRPNSQQGKSTILGNNSISPSDYAADQLKMARDAYLESNYSYSLELASHAYIQLGPSSELFVLVADNYIAQHLYHQAELYLLHAALIDKPTINIYFNLVTICRLRHDKSSAYHYLSKLASIDPNNQYLKPLKDSLDNQFANSQYNAYDFTSKLSYDSPSSNLVQTIK